MDLAYVTEHAPATGRTWQPGDAFLAGGTWLFSEPQPTVHRLLDLQAYGWPAVRVDDDGVELAATCTLAELAAWSPPAVWPAAVLARQCCDALLGSFKIWNAATVGGNICLALPAGPMTSLAASLDGRCEVWSPDGSVRQVPAADFVVGVRTTVLVPGELLRAIRLPASALRARAAFRQMSLSTYGRSAALVIGRVDENGETVITITASTPRPIQLRFSKLPAAEPAVAAVEHAVAGRWHDDLHGAPAWRSAMTARLVGEVIGELGSPP